MESEKDITQNRLTQQESRFVSDLKNIAGEARSQAYRAADHLLVVRNWLIGWRIVEQEQEGKERAEYGKRVLELASQSLTEEYGRGFGLTSIKNMRSFYIKFRNLQIRQSLLDEFNITQFPFVNHCLTNLLYHSIRMCHGFIMNVLCVLRMKLNVCGI